MIDETPEPFAVEPTPVVFNTEVVEPVFAPEPVVEPEVVYVAPEPEIAPVELPKSKKEDPSRLKGSRRVVSLSKLVFQSSEKNSASVGLVQFRLVECGEYDAGSDKYGWLGVGTKKALASYAGKSQDKVNLQDEKLIKRLFEGTDVEVTP